MENLSQIRDLMESRRFNGAWTVILAVLALLMGATAHGKDFLVMLMIAGAMECYMGYVRRDPNAKLTFKITHLMWFLVFGAALLGEQHYGPLLK